jgi:hypothetical protein
MKTIKQSAEEYANRTDKANAEWVMKDFLAGVEFAQRWISVGEELPEEISTFNHGSLYVLIKTDIEFIRIAKYEHRKKQWITIENGLQKPLNKDLGKVTHWRHIKLK